MKVLKFISTIFVRRRIKHINAVRDKEKREKREAKAAAKKAKEEEKAAKAAKKNEGEEHDQTNDGFDRESQPRWHTFPFFQWKT